MKPAPIRQFVNSSIRQLSLPLLAAALTLAACTATPTKTTIDTKPDNALPPNGGAHSDPTQYKLVWLMTNLSNDQALADDIALMQRASKAGYTHVVVSDVKFMKWDFMGPKYAANVKKFVDTCHSLKIKVWACCSPMGYAESLLMRDPNLAEGLPVEGDFIVDQGLFLKPYDPDLVLFNGNFEEVISNNTPALWASDAFNTSVFLDDKITWNGKPTLRIDHASPTTQPTGEARAAGETTFAPGVSQTILVKPFHYYHVHAMIKTEGKALKRGTQIEVVADQPNHPDNKTRLNYQTPVLAETTEWQEFNMTFNSLEFSKVKLTLPGRQSRGGGGTGIQGAGTIHWADLTIEPAQFVNVIRRPGAPVELYQRDPHPMSIARKFPVIEGKDTTPIIDPLAGHTPGSGHFNIWHTPPVISIPVGTRLHPGDILHASYYVPAIIHDSQVMCCMSEPKTLELCKWEIQNIHKFMKPDGYFTGHDELRSQGYDKSCVDTGKSMHQILADNVHTIVKMIKTEDPGKEICTWSDLFDPFHNAKNDDKRYYLVKGHSPWYGAWTGLDPDVIIMNWHAHDKNNNAAMKFFADLGNPQILSGYYDKENLAPFKERLDAASHYPKIIGSMYTTWTSNFTQMEPFAQLLNEWKSQSAAAQPAPLQGRLYDRVPAPRPFENP